MSALNIRTKHCSQSIAVCGLMYITIIASLSTGQLTTKLLEVTRFLTYTEELLIFFKVQHVTCCYWPRKSVLIMYIPIYSNQPQRWYSWP